MNAPNHYDVIVTGVGSMGAAACWYLAKRDYKVLGLEQFDIPHEQGSHAGQSRIIRKAYFEIFEHCTVVDDFEVFDGLPTGGLAHVFGRIGELDFESHPLSNHGFLGLRNACDAFFDGFYFSFLCFHSVFVFVESQNNGVGNRLLTRYAAQKRAFSTVIQEACFNQNAGHRRFTKYQKACLLDAERLASCVLVETFFNIFGKQNALVEVSVLEQTENNIRFVGVRVEAVVLLLVVVFEENCPVFTPRDLEVFLLLVHTQDVSFSPKRAA